MSSDPSTAVSDSTTFPVVNDIKQHLRDGGVSQEWQQLDLELVREQMTNSKPPTEASRAKYNSGKDRYGQFFTFDHTRVKLEPRQGNGDTLPGSDYINANYITTPLTRYIAAQAPVYETLGDFWRMIWEQDVGVIVMLTKLLESGRVKAYPYWPEVDGMDWDEDSAPNVDSDSFDDIPELGDESDEDMSKGNNAYDLNRKQAKNWTTYGEIQVRSLAEHSLGEVVVRKLALRRAPASVIAAERARGEDESPQITPTSSSSTSSSPSSTSTATTPDAAVTACNGVNDSKEDVQSTTNANSTDTQPCDGNNSTNISSKQTTDSEGTTAANDEDDEEEERILYHLQYVGWPDQGVPTSVDGSYQLLQLVQRYTEEQKDRKGAPVVHCSAGVGRTGTFCTIHAELARFHKFLKENPDSSDFQFTIADTVREMRKQRWYMVQRECQLDFCYKVIDYVVDREMVKRQQAGGLRGCSLIVSNSNDDEDES